MTVSRKEGPFVAEITGELLSVHRTPIEESVGAGSLTGHGVTMLFTCSLRNMPWFVMHGDGLYAQNAHDALTPLYHGSDAAQLLGCLKRLLTSVESKRIRSRRNRKYGYAAAALFLAGILLSVPVIVHDLVMPAGSGQLSKENTPLSALAVREPVAASPTISAPAMLPSYDKDSRTGYLALPQQQLPATYPDDGWNLPQSVRAQLPTKLHNAASRGLFTVPLSSGHARTIYVFADPACPNCQRMERHFETVSGTVNVVIFPVTIEGHEASLKALTPVMALPEAERSAAWKQLFSADAGIGVPGTAQGTPAVTDETLAEMARGAIGVNEVSFRAFRLPGTPWTISDDGRYVPQSVLNSPAALTDFLNGGDHDGQ
ncbi:TrbB protein [Kosakonia radicincitans]|uniref:TrbB protein n=2 Tax=Kosakonia radicincitans TaxID=283686 RepID=A0AAX2EZD9_9ENTR|nr:thioredoxin fold domain-containing protein [Kosakonia radicincitans]SFF38330.1 TrbB protein [Kosakonia radicincitans]SFR26295.1 TrbB protein [Kosakonia radicincitans]SFU16790.1 TrbB protein [Kosakonia radicincitans]SFY32206.1 TrbB protein [Kosakonia radicincitans]